MEPGQAARNQALNFRRDFAFGQIDKLRAEGVRDHAVKPGFIDEAVINHGLSNRFTIQLCFLENIIRLRWLQNALLHEKIGDLFVVHVWIGGTPATRVLVSATRRNDVRERKSSESPDSARESRAL